MQFLHRSKGFTKQAQIVRCCSGSTIRICSWQSTHFLLQEGGLEVVGLIIVSASGEEACWNTAACTAKTCKKAYRKPRYLSATSVGIMLVQARLKYGPCSVVPD